MSDKKKKAKLHRFEETEREEETQNVEQANKENKPSVASARNNDSEKDDAINKEDVEEEQLEPTATVDVADRQEEDNADSATNVATHARPEPSQPGAFRVGDDTDDTVTIESARVARQESSSALPIAAEVATDLEAVVAERESLRKQLHDLQQERQGVVQADAIAVDTEKVGIMNAPRKLRHATDFSLFSTKRPKNGVAGMSSGVKNICKGTFAGFACLFGEPIAGAQQEGATGFAKGCATGVGKAVALPVAGIFVGFYQMGRGASNSVTSAVSKTKKLKKGSR